ncbi:MAG: outer membrane beta-barrel protein [Chitinophagaceae bacterium]|nr:outer membrane beta-barrel protein [Chitinophagaceae bacterium]
MTTPVFYIKTWAILIAFLFLNLFSTAQQTQPKGKFYGGCILGAGGLALNANDQQESRTARFGLSLFAGYRIKPWIRAGISLNGWTVEPYNSYFDYYYFYYQEYPPKGISISNVFGQVQLFPLKNIDLFLNMEGGWSKYINMNPNAYDAKGYGGKAGIGYEYYIGKGFALNLTANYSLGKFNDIHYPEISFTNQHYNAFEILLGVTLR